MYTLPSLVTFSLPCEIPIVVQLITNKCSYWLSFLYTLPSLVTFSLIDHLYKCSYWLSFFHNLPSLVTFSLRDHLQVFLFPQLSAHSSLIGSCDIALRTKLHNKQSFLLTQVSANSSFTGQLSLTRILYSTYSCIHMILHISHRPTHEGFLLALRFVQHSFLIGLYCMQTSYWLRISSTRYF